MFMKQFFSEFTKLMEQIVDWIIVKFWDPNDYSTVSGACLIYVKYIRTNLNVIKNIKKIENLPQN